jgi:periplasmic divalent cation tolerance protein
MTGRELVVVLITAGSADEAQRIAGALLEQRAIACASIVQDVRSFFRWNDALQSEDEVLMVVKTTRDALDTVGNIVRALHSYEVPEVIALPVLGGSEAYLEWVRAEVSAPQAD